MTGPGAYDPQQIGDHARRQVHFAASGLPPFFSRKYDLKNHPNYRYTAEADKKNAFELDRLIRRHRPPGSSEFCEECELDVPDESNIGGDEDILNYDDIDDPDAFV